MKHSSDASPLPFAWLPHVCRIAVAAGGEVMDVYAGEFVVDEKADRSPLTEADRRSHSLIHDSLSGSPALPEIPILSEEGAQTPFAERAEWGDYWLVDPLDGTKEFVKRNGEFTVNIALVRGGRPVLGVVFAPALKTLYFGAAGYGAFRLNVSDGGAEELDDRHVRDAAQIRVRGQGEAEGITVVASRSHLNDETRSFIEGIEATYGGCETVSKGSSLKLCLVAEGRADVYPRFGPTMEWDTAAGDAVARAAGALVTTTDGSTPLAYNKENLLNPYFIVRAPWLSVSGIR